MVALRHAVLAIVGLLFAACAQSPLYSPGHPIITDASGHQVCAQHHIPLVTAPGYTMNVARAPTIDPDNAAEIRLEQCNPNAILDYFSLRHTKLFSIPRKITYCPTCEANVHNYRLQHWGAYYHSDDSGGSWYPEDHI